MAASYNAKWPSHLLVLQLPKMRWLFPTFMILEHLRTVVSAKNWLMPSNRNCPEDCGIAFALY